MGERFTPRTSRRGFLGGLAALPFAATPGIARAEEETESRGDLELHELSLDGDPSLARRAVVLVPKRIPAGARLPVLVLLHGLGETGDPKVGVRAWCDHYGLAAADARLRRPPLPEPSTSRYVSNERLGRINLALADVPYSGAVLVCPFTPNIHKAPSAPRALDRYADWVEHTLLPAVRSRAPCREDAQGTAIDGCSLGGYMALGVFLRKPELFGAMGTVQPAIGEAVAPLYAELLHKAVSRVGPRSIHLETSAWDPELPAHQALTDRLRSLNVPHEFEILPGGHDQIFLREIGTLEMLLWHDRRFTASPQPPASGSP